MVRLFESLRAVFYAPFYLALELDAYGKRGLEVEFGRPDSPDDAASSLFGSGADVIWGGPMRMMQPRPDFRLPQRASPGGSATATGRSWRLRRP